ncbi:hypothetical protein CFIMG_007805RA00001 [Ceratocystis fimbriata CBS 114723]|uniref:Uncharacterized protein n=1 Tax=Ceratocystis fimbriata CBS 114723 TaxID=1035309 RepID=A0A2C5WTI3_9PEZI|nr:hypothetical protein CFIMG_007805RA00001 [Ceratocystis fimbriata CBS 114723]
MLAPKKPDSRLSFLLQAMVGRSHRIDKLLTLSLNNLRTTASVLVVGMKCVSRAFHSAAYLSEASHKCLVNSGNAAVAHQSHPVPESMIGDGANSGPPPETAAGGCRKSQHGHPLRLATRLAESEIWTPLIGPESPLLRLRVAETITCRSWVCPILRCS